jgi:hypothetical protein
MGKPPPAHLAWAGHCSSVELSADDVEAMDIALSLMPELRLAALAVARSRRLSLKYPIRSAATVQQLLGKEGRLTAGGHEIDAAAVRQFLVPGDLPIEHEGALANAVFTALQRCRRRQELEQALKSFDAGLAPDPDAGLAPDHDREVTS